MKLLLLGCTLVSIVGCVTTPPVPDRAAEQLRDIGDGYGVVVAISPAKDSDTEKMCREGKGLPEFLEICPRLEDFNVVTSNVAATSGKSFLKSVLFADKKNDIRRGDIIHFKFGKLFGFVAIASRGERKDCRWAGSSYKLIGLPGQEGGIECDGWTYKSLAKIDWKPATWFPF